MRCIPSPACTRYHGNSGSGVTCSRSESTPHGASRNPDIWDDGVGKYEHDVAKCDDETRNTVEALMDGKISARLGAARVPLRASAVKFERRRGAVWLH